MFLIRDSGLKLERVIEPFDKQDKIWGTGYRRALVSLPLFPNLFELLSNQIFP